MYSGESYITVKWNNNVAYVFLFLIKGKYWLRIGYKQTETLVGLILEEFLQVRTPFVLVNYHEMFWQLQSNNWAF